MVQEIQSILILREDNFGGAHNAELVLYITTNIQQLLLTTNKLDEILLNFQSFTKSYKPFLTIYLSNSISSIDSLRSLACYFKRVLSKITSNSMFSK
ncbi:hypothetical protein GWI33_006006 [Rhynchophorus ferrugineus]|uniref:Uncharacterized protein n=1 Tax=Rhynchophorus ferrugineus TaxID=354439 RepID=A0A834IWV4_RHYFE|nr:hypothetical protein GWI33_006006 [Rhynchophorus ferrugineus]